VKRVDIETWSRRAQYKYFSMMQCPYCSVTCDVDVANALTFMKAEGIPAYIGMIYLVTKAANQVPELKTRIEGEEVNEYEVIHPSFTLLNEAEQLLFCRARYQDDATAFIASTRQRVEQVKKAPECVLEANGQDVLYLSCLPWIHFTSINHPMFIGQPDAVPRIIWGRFQPKENTVVMAVNIQVHHGLADGLHMSRFLLALGGLCAEPEKAFTGMPTAR
jgi:Chloramphenicol O-acetyltransferase